MDTWQLRVSSSRALESADGVVRPPLRAISVRQALVDARRFGIKPPHLLQAPLRQPQVGLTHLVGVLRVLRSEVV